MTGFDSLTLAFQGCFETSTSELPDKLRQRAQQEFASLKWDRLSPDQRRSVARQLDSERNPATERERRFWSDFFERRADLETQLAEWKMVATPTAGDLALSKAQLKELRQELSRMDAKLKQARGDTEPDSGDMQETHAVAVTSAGAVIVDTAAEKQVHADNSNRLQAGGVGEGKAGSANPCAAFQSMQNLRADELTITIVGDRYEGGLGANNILEISARKMTKRVALAAVDLVDRRKGVPNTQGMLLLGMATGRRLAWSTQKAKQIERLRKVLRSSFGLVGDPFERYRKEGGWMPLFTVTDKRGAADARAKLEAERRSVTLDDLEERGSFVQATQYSHRTFDAEGDAADEWLQAHDPEQAA